MGAFGELISFVGKFDSLHSTNEAIVKEMENEAVTPSVLSSTVFSLASSNLL